MGGRANGGKEMWLGQREGGGGWVTGKKRGPAREGGPGRDGGTLERGRDGGREAVKRSGKNSSGKE
jgi:hypothetical protein